MNAKRWFALLAAAVLLIVSLGAQTAFSLWNTVSNQAQNQQNQENIVKRGSSDNRIAMLDVEGTIQSSSGSGAFSGEGYNHEEFLSNLEEAGSSADVDGIIINVNSPGGGVVESDEIHDAVVEVQEEENKPVYVSMGNTAASGGYYLAAPADKIVAHSATITGSIGVIMSSLNYSELAENLGIDSVNITSGEFKDIGSPTEEVTEEDREIMQGIVDDMYEDFLQVVIDGRGFSEEKARNLADGRIYTGEQAEENGLIDELGTTEDTISMMEEDLELGDATVERYTSDGFSWQSLLQNTVQGMFISDEKLLGLQELLKSVGSASPRPMYLYEG
ncbi:signal peptide peptidase SppA [Marinococcus halophilus]|nr:signal peptide peptidase SppA [Marinococcus halophilus]OZT80092.1 signal peptide peptidase SppA [Marinococcus halophilus]